MKRTILNLLVLSISAATANAQPARESAARQPFTKFIPSTTGLYLSVNQLGDLNGVLCLPPLQEILAIVTGQKDARQEKKDVLSAFKTFIGEGHQIDFDQFVKCEVGMVAPSVSDLSSVMWFLRMPLGVTARQWFPESSNNQDQNVSSSILYRSTKGLVVLTHEDIVVLARLPMKGLYLREIYQLMRNQKQSSLQQHRDYQELLAYKPPNALGTMFIVPDKAQPASDSTSMLWPMMKSALVGIYERDGQLDLTVRGVMRRTLPSGRVTPAAMDRFLNLPATTLFAMISPLDLDLSLPPDESTITSSFSRYLSFLMRYRDSRWIEAGPVPHIGPHMVVAWGQEMRLDQQAPQLALLMESKDVTRLRDEMTGIAGNLIEMMLRFPPVSGGMELSLQQEEYLGVPIYSVSIQTKTKDHSWSKIVDAIEPCWASWRGWFIFALSRDHLERILDAQFGMAPTMATWKDVRSFRRQRTHRSHVAFMQPQLAAEVLNGWIQKSNDPQTGVQSGIFADLVNPKPKAKATLGIGVTTQQQAGVVVVARVYPDSLATNLLEPEDRIIGVDGEVLDLESPNADLRRRWSYSQTKPGPTFRVIRAGEIMDVVLPKEIYDASNDSLPINPGEVIRDAISLGETIPFASFVAFVSDDNHYSAKFTIRMAPQEQP